jgi:hypothetical protein
MTAVEKIVGLKRWFKHNADIPPTAELSDKGLLIPGNIAGYEFREDFDAYRVSAASVVGWHLDESGTSTAAAMTTDPFGVVTAKAAASNGANFHYQWALNTTVLTPATIAAGKRVWLKTRFKVEDADQNLPRVGLINPTDDPWNAEETDQFQFRTLAAAPQTLQFACGKTATTEVTIALGDLADNTFVRLEAFYDGADTVWAFRFDDSGNIVASGMASVTTTVSGDLLPDAALTYAWGMENVDNGADDFHIDYLHFYAER